MSELLKQRTLGRTGLKVSEIGLGTTVIGYVYGIGPRDLPPEDEVLQFLHEVVERGVTFIDTGSFYGVAEERIGKSGVAKMPGVIVSTKCGHVLDKGEDISDEALAKVMREDVESSLRKLGLDHLELVQVHGGTAERIKDGSIIQAVQKLKDAGLVRFAGISTRGEEAPLAAIESGFFDVLQLAHSILDQRMEDRVIAEAAKHNIGIINRSALLKGALTPAAEYLSPVLAPLKKNSDAAKRIAENLGIDLPTLALRFALSSPEVGSVLVGTNKISHLQSALDASGQGPLTQDVLDELHTLAVDDPMQVDPKNWPSSMVADTVGGKKVPHPNR